MPQLPPAAAAAFVGCLLVVIIATAVIVRVRSRRRGVRLAEMVRTTAPVPRPATSRVAQPSPATAAPVRGRLYRSAEELGRFVVFVERPRRDPAPGRPTRRLAAQLAYAAAPPPVAAPQPSPVPVVPARPRVALPSIALALASHAGLAEVLLDLTAPGEREMRAGTSGGRSRPAAPVPTAPWLVEPLAPEDPIAQSPWLVEPTVVESAAVEPAALAEPAVAEPPKAEPSIAEPQEGEPRVAELLVAEPLVVEPAAVESADAAPETLDEEREPEFVASSWQASTRPLREPQITVLPPRPPVPALPAMMSREVTLGDAARVLRGALPSVLTMTDGRQLRRAVAVGAATSVVAAAFAIRARRR